MLLQWNCKVDDLLFRRIDRDTPFPVNFLRTCSGIVIGYLSNQNPDDYYYVDDTIPVAPTVDLWRTLSTYLPVFVQVQREVV